jgi:hypothetical protein
MSIFDQQMVMKETTYTVKHKGYEGQDTKYDLVCRICKRNTTIDRSRSIGRDDVVICDICWYENSALQ